jgi:hypothetical protein
MQERDFWRIGERVQKLGHPRKSLVKKITNWVGKRGELKVREGIDIEIGERGGGKSNGKKKKG